MKKTIVPAAAAIALLSCGSFTPCFSQSAGLPATVMGKFVHTPGDNQYTEETQAARHIPLPRPVAAAPALPNPSHAEWHPTPRPVHPDPSLEPIAADEPVVPPGFPPLPDRLDLPVSLSWSGSHSSGGGSYGGSGAGANGSGGNVPGLSGGGSGGSGAHGFSSGQGVAWNQGYMPSIHQQPGAFIPQGGMHHDYYKCTSSPEQFATNNQDDATEPGAPKYTGASGRDLAQLGKEPKLSDHNDQPTNPEAPTPVVVSQSVSKDLSLPEDEFSSEKPKNNNLRGPARVLKNVARQAMYTALGAGMSAGNTVMHF